MKFALFFMGEYMAMSASSAIIVTLLFGGYQIPFLNTEVMHHYINLIFIGLMIIVPLLSLGFIKWMQKNNSSDESRRRETKYGTILITIFVIVFDTFLFYLLTSGISDELGSVSIMIMQILTYAFKVMMMNFVFVWVRWTFPRFRYDQIQHLGWKILIPLALLNIFITATFVVLAGV